MTKKSIIIVLLFFILLTIVFTFPLILNINSFIPGFASTDEPYGALWYFWWLKYSHLRHLDITKINIIAVPFGQIIHPGYFYWNLINKGLVLISNPIFTYNIQIVLSFILAGLITYLLVFYLLKNTLAALFSGLVFAFSPYHFVRSWQHLGLAQIQWMPLYLLSLLVLRQNKTIRNALFVALTFSLVMTFDLYYAYFMFIITILFIFFDYLYQKNLKEISKLLKLLLVSGLCILGLKFVDIYYSIKSIIDLNRLNIANTAYGYIRPFQDLFAQSARPLSYFLPAPAHPIFGKFTERFIGSQIYGISLTEHTLYLGWTTLILAFFAFRRWRGFQRIKESFCIGFFVFLAILAWFFSQPPWWKIGPIKIYMPSFFMYKIAPMFRAYCRFGIVVMLAMAVLAGIGLKLILEKFKTRKVKIAVTALFCSIILFEFWNYPPFKVIDLEKTPQVYYWLKKQAGDFVIAEYPLDTEGVNEIYKFYQTIHEKKIVNGTISGTYANKLAKAIINLSEPYTAGVLKWMGVKYVLVHRDDYLKTELVEEIKELNKIPNNPGLRLIKTFPAQGCPNRDVVCVQETGPIDVYEVLALAIEPEIKEKR